ncbi:Transposon TX1 uncharacterized 149 kDa protein [Vitis vinifera]|uniref:Transposon TX1 uncharacterized 149 kDa protein n=1 Tax=Vitis vinifera TaxID=29760 RepID=A0A438CHQ0_VITVI|nr:Transposon TX1 uncharacterized 149 kDa protein [Vitis vinifera]
MFGSQLGLLHPAVNLTANTDRVLLEEASRYFDQFSCSLFSLGKRETSLFSTPSGLDGEGVAIAKVSDRGNGLEAIGGAVMGPLRMILADGREAEVSDLAGRESGTFEEASEEETKIQEMSMGIIRSLRVGRFLEWGAVDSRGAVGGIVVFWDNRVLDLVKDENIELRGRFHMDVYRVYGPTLRRNRERFWEELGAIEGLWNGPWCVAGDFNVILSPEERNRGGSLNSNMRRFSEVIEDLELEDLPMVGGPFTWIGGVNNQSFSKLDRFLVNEGWDSHFGDARQFVLPRSVFDHFPVLLDGGGLRRGPSPFRFENMWLKVEGVKDLLKHWWEEGLNRKNLALEQVEFWDTKEKISRLSLEARKEAREDYKKWVLLDEITWRQKSKEVWLKEGDRNTFFFHKMANAHRRRNNVDKIKINRVWLMEENGIREGIANAFRLLLSNPGEWRPSVSGLQFETLEPLDASALEIPFSEEEVFDALLGWVEALGDFRPISLVGSLYKWLAKVLANRLKKVVGKVVSKAQGAFVEGRQILDVVLIANEAIDSVLKNNESGILCKLDIEKAYDNVDWTFILTVMQKMGFGEKWIRWIKWCISTASFSVLVNGTPTGFFQSSRGLRQGDPLSPYLFMIAMEVLVLFLKGL